jgi:hypothetical protein
MIANDGIFDLGVGAYCNVTADAVFSFQNDVDINFNILPGSMNL